MYFKNHYNAGNQFQMFLWDTSVRYFKCSKCLSVENWTNECWYTMETSFRYIFEGKVVKQEDIEPLEQCIYICVHTLICLI